MHFKSPQKDTCKTCDVLKIKIEATDEDKDQQKRLQEQLLSHRVRAGNIFDNRKKCIRNADDRTKVITFDLEKTLPLPLLRTNEVYYSRQLCLYNFGIHHYPENEGKRGSEDVASCLLDFFNGQNVHDNVNTIIAFSDACGGKNRNYKVARYLMYAVNTLKNVQTIEVNFMESGHSFLPNDSDFSNISDAMKHETHIYTLQEYVKLIESCVKKIHL